MKKVIEITCSSMGYGLKYMECMPKRAASCSDTPRSSKVAGNEAMISPDAKNMFSKKISSGKIFSRSKKLATLRFPL